MGNLIFSKIIKVKLNKYKVEQFKFKSSTDCTLYYNQLVKKYVDEEPKKTLSYDLDDWTSNNFLHHNMPLNISRFGDVIQLIESKQIIDLKVFKNDFSKIYTKIKDLQH